MPRPLNLADVLEVMADAVPDRPAVISLDRTWTYLREESGASVVSHRDSGGHGLSAGAADALSGWVTSTLGA